MDEMKLKAAGINVEEGLHRFNNNAMLYEKFLYKFPKDANYRALQDAAAAGDVKAAFEAGHALKGMAGNLSMTELYNALMPLVEVYRAGTMEGAAPLMETVCKAYDKVAAALTE